MHKEMMWQPSEMNRFSESLLAEARKVAKEMLESKEAKRSLDVGEQKEALWLSTNPDEIMGSEKFILEGTTFYLGLPKEDQSEE